ncbi:sugar-binding domain-containing protein [Bifidobacterium sp. B4077]|uniref:sugar-binding domain-containing protein n=2 Tax=Bifidobacterium TaxID=1678 RepID=UPI00226B873A|nr:sugar-binding domain-containing protein [Bifidobacterium sp. B4077]
MGSYDRISFLQLILKHLSGVEILQPHGFGNMLSFGGNYFTQILTPFGTTYDAQVHLFPALAIFDCSETRELMWKETSIRQMLELRRSLDLIITFAGTPYEATPSPLFSSGALSRHDREELNREHVVGGCDLHLLLQRRQHICSGSRRDCSTHKYRRALWHGLNRGGFYGLIDLLDANHIQTPGCSYSMFFHLFIYQ